MRGTLAFRSDARHEGKPAGEDCYHPGDGIAPHADLVAGIKSAGFVRYRHFQRHESAADQFTHQLEVEVKPVAAQGQLVQAVRAQHLIHGGRVGEAHAKQQVEEGVKGNPAEIHARRPQAVTGEFPDFPAVRTHMAATEHECRAPLYYRLEQLRVVCDVVLQVGVLYQQDLAARRGESLPDRVSLAPRPVLTDDLDTRSGLAGMARTEFGDDLA